MQILKKLLLLAFLTPIPLVLNTALLPSIASANTVNSDFNISITSHGLSPSTMTIDSGDSIGFTNNDSVPHTLIFTETGSVIGCTPNPLVLLPGDTGICYYETPGTISITDTAGTGGTLTAIQCCTAPAFTSASSATFAVGSPANFTITTSGAPHPQISESGALPGGLVFTPNAFNGEATITGTPTAGGSFTLALSGNNQAGPVATQSLAITVTGGSPTTTTAPASTTTTTGGKGSTGGKGTTTRAPVTKKAGAGKRAAPNAPAIVSALSSNKTLVLNWAAPTKPGSKAVTTYDVGIATCATVTRCSLHVLKVTDTVLSQSFSALTNNKAYWLFVSATSSAGTSAKSVVRAVPSATGSAKISKTNKHSKSTKSTKTSKTSKTSKHSVHR